MTNMFIKKTSCWGFRLMTVFVAFTSLVHAEAVSDSAIQDHWGADEQMIYELMQLETANLLHQKQQDLSLQAGEGGARYGGVSISARAEMTALKAVYGTGNQLAVEVSHRGQHYFFPAGQSVPLGSDGHDSGLRLNKVVAPSCVELIVQEQTLVRCVIPSLD